MATVQWLSPLLVTMAGAWSLWRQRRRRRADAAPVDANGSASVNRGAPWDWWLWQSTLIAVSGLFFLVWGLGLWAAFALVAAVWGLRVAQTKRASSSPPHHDPRHE